jgi:hypothetical protein
MLPTTLILEVIAMCFLFLLSSIWSEENVRFGYILLPLTAAFFWFAGFLPFTYMTTVIPLLIFMGIITFMRSQLRFKWGFGGTGAGILYKLVFFLIMIQLAIGYVNGMGLFTANVAENPSNEFTTYDLQKANDTFYATSSGIDALDMINNSLTIVWTIFGVLWSMLASVFLIYPTLVNIFHIPADLSILIQAGIYIIYALELFNMIYKPSKPAEV